MAGDSMILRLSGTLVLNNRQIFITKERELRENKRAGG